MAILQDVINEYNEYLEAANAYQAYLEQKVATLELLAEALGGCSRSASLDLDEEIPF